ncbi:hypothetical protein CHIBA101_1908 [Actinomyces sp. Chiba101]|nr:hypothetical protein CHIBA101_1908 [Actinomyces sp. Chiba101]
MWSAGEWARAPGRWGCWGGVIDVVDERGWVLTEDAGSATAMTRRVEADADEDDIPAFGTNSAGERLVVLDVLSDEGTVIVLGGWYTPREPGSGARDMETQEFRLELMRIRLSDGTITGGLALGTHTLIVNDFLGRFLSWVDADAVMALVNESLFHTALAVVVDLGTMTARLDTAGLTEASGGSPFFTRLRGRAVGYGDEPPEGRSLGEFSRCLDARDGTRIEAEPGWMILGLFDDWMFTCPRPQQRASDPATGLRSTNLRTRETIDVGHAIAPLWLGNLCYKDGLIISVGAQDPGGVPHEVLRPGAGSAVPLPHRTEHAAVHGGAVWTVLSSGTSQPHQDIVCWDPDTGEEMGRTRIKGRPGIVGLNAWGAWSLSAFYPATAWMTGARESKGAAHPQA